MGNNALYQLKVTVSGGIWSCQEITGVKNIKPLVFHGATIEIVDGNNHVAIKVILSAENMLIPCHRLMDGSKGMMALVYIVVFGIDMDPDRAAALGGKGIA